MSSRRSRCRSRAALLAPLTALVLAVAPLAPAATAASVPRFSLSTSAVAVPAGGTATVVLTLASTSPSGAAVVVRALPAGVTPSAARLDSRHWQVVLTATGGAPTAVSLAQVALRVSSTQRTASLAVAVVGAAPPVTTPPVTTPPVTTPAPSVRDVLLRPDNPYQVTARGGTAVYGVTVNRTGWSGPVDLTVDEAPSGWSASFAPDPTSASTNLYVVVPATAAPGDYVIRFSGSSGTVKATSLVLAHVPDPQLVVVPYGWILTDSSGVAQFEVDLRVFDDREPGGTALTIAGLPAGAGYVVAPTATAGRVAVTLTVYYGTVPGSYAIELVGTKGARTTRVPMRLLVGSLGATTGSFRFAVTAVPPTAGEVRGWGLSAQPAAWSTPRGTAVSFDVTVRPTGGFADPIDVSLGLPSGWGATFAATTVANVFRVTVGVPSTATVSPYSLVLLTTSGTLSASVNLGVTVSA